MTDTQHFDFMTWLCPFCGRITSTKLPTTYLPNLTCEHPEHNLIAMMVQVWPPLKEIGNAN